MPHTAGAHVRDHRSVLAAAEKRLLIAIATSLPRRIHSDHLSGLALLSMFGVGAAFAAMRVTPGAWIAVIVGLALNWFGDSLDGTVARVRHHERPRFGFYVDHVIDLAGTAALFAGLAGSGLMTPWLAMAVLVGYLLLCAESFLATHATGVFRMSRWGVGPTELRLLIALGAFAASRHPLASLPLVGVRRLFDVGGVVAIIGFAAAFLSASIRQTRELYRLEPISSPAGAADPCCSPGRYIRTARRPAPTES
jgi:phosphatidylglycerophosphate synthase